MGAHDRLLDVIRRGKIFLDEFKSLISEEADRMLDPSFEGNNRQLVNISMAKERQTFSQDFIANLLFIVVANVRGANSHITQVLHKVEKNSRKDKLIGIFKQNI